MAMNSISRFSLFKLLGLFVIMLFSIGASANKNQVDSENNRGYIGSDIGYLIDEGNSVTAANVDAQTFSASKTPVLNLGFSDKPVWLKISDFNKSKIGNFYINYAFSLVDSIWVYKKSGSQVEQVYQTGANFKNANRFIKHQNFIFPVACLKAYQTDIYIKLRSSGQLIIPVSVEQPAQLISSLTAVDYWKGIFYGVLIAMIFYNLIISVFIRDRSYYFYVAYIFFIAISQSLLDGYFQRYIFGDSPYLTHVLVIFAPSMAGFFVLYFAQVFLQVKKFSKRLNIGIIVLQVFYLLIAILSFYPKLSFLYSLVDIAALLVAVYSLVFSSIIAKAGSRPARFFLIAFTTVLLALVVFVFRNIGVIPYGFFSNNALQIGFGVQVMLLSIALADRINTLRKEKELSQAQALKSAQENQNLIKRQNIELEQRVDERTLELQEANEELQVTLDNLKETQSQLVDSEKMASLGQLTAGIAHEINNPINFVTSNITPLRRDLADIYEIVQAYSNINMVDIAVEYKKAKEKEQELEFDYLQTEINSLVDGISEGANRTKEIVQGLRTFSRLDEDTAKQANLHENLRSTLVLLNNKISGEIKIEEIFDSQIGDIECYPGKLNQVFMNILNNAIYAVQHKSYEENETPTVTIKTEREGSEIIVTISDNGIGMSTETQKKIFEPFFTTKDVGEGTGLGMSIVFKIIQKHNGNVAMHSKLGSGTDFSIHLPISQPSEF